MGTAQSGIFALGTRSHYHLEFELRDGAELPAVVEALRNLRGPDVTAGGANVVVGFGPGVWSGLCDEAEDPTYGEPLDLVAFTPITGIDGHVAPATQHDIWVWVHGTGADVVFDVARCVVAAFAPVGDLVAEQPCFVYRDSRDLTGFIDGTANPGADEAPQVAQVPHGDPGSGGSIVLAQRWVHDLAGFHAQPVSVQEAVIGRTKPDSVEMDEDAKPPTAHIARVEIEDPSGAEEPIYRRSTPYGSVAEAGLYFLAFSAEQQRFERMLARMYGVGAGDDADGRRDHLLDYTHPVSGSYYFAPSLEDLNAVLA